MRSFRDDIEQSFIPRFGAVAKIILVNVSVYVLLGAVGVVLLIANNGELFHEIIQHWLALPASLSNFIERPWTLFTYSIVHAYPGGLLDVLHIVFNMMWLFWMGRILREYVGDRTVWSVYLYGIFVGAVFFLLLFNLSPFFSQVRDRGFIIGASAGVSAIVVATATLLPNYRIGMMFVGLIQLKWLALFFVLLDVIMMLGMHNAGGLMSHLGGAFIGFLYIQQRREGRDLAFPFLWLAGKIRGIFRPRPSKSHRNLTRSTVQNKRVEVRNGSRQTAYPSQSSDNATADNGDKPSQEEIDRILERIKEVGYDRLTKAEKQALYRFSQEQ